MEERIFTDKSYIPTEETLKTGLGKAYSYYKKLNVLVINYLKNWSFTKNSGWSLKCYDKKKALFYLIPLKEEIKISLTLRENEKNSILKEQSLDISILNKIENAKKYIEGYAIQLNISTEKEYSIFKKLIRKLIELRG